MGFHGGRLRGWGKGMGSCIRGTNGRGRGRKEGGRVALRLGEGMGSRIRGEKRKGEREGALRF